MPSYSAGTRRAPATTSDSKVGHPRLHGIRKPGRVRTGANVVDAVLGEAEDAHPRTEAPRRRLPDGVEDDHVHALDQAGDYRAGHLVVLVRVHPDAEHARLPGGLEDPVPRRAGGVEEDVGPRRDLERSE